MPVVPIARGRKGQRLQQPPPAEPFALMAAATMHQAGHLAPEAEGPQEVIPFGKEPA